MMIWVHSAADLLGNALENPEKGLGRLERKFKDLSPAQKEVIEQFVKQGDVAAAQAIIIEHLEAKTKGLAESQAQGLTGSANRLSDAWDNLLESFAETTGISSGVEKGLSGIASALEGLNLLVSSEKEAQATRKQYLIDLYENSIGGLIGDTASITRLKEEIKKIDQEIAEEKQKELGEQLKARESAEKAAAEQRGQIISELEKKFAKEREDIILTEQEKILKNAGETHKQINALNRDGKNSDAAAKAIAALDEVTKAKLDNANKSAIESAKQLAETNDKVIETLQKRLALESLSSPKDKFIQSELDKLNAKATAEYKSKVRELSATLYEKEAASKAAKEAEEDHKKAIEEINRETLQLIPSYDLAKQALDEWKEKTIKNLGEAAEENKKYFELVEQIYSVKLKEIYDKSLQDSRKWEDGATRALQRYAEEATNAAKNAEDVFGSAAQKIEDTLVDIVSTGEFSFKKLGDLVLSIEKDIMRAFIRQNITGPLAAQISNSMSGAAGGGNIFGNIFGSLFHEGGIVGENSVSRREVPAYFFAGALRFHDGLMPDEFPAILQKGETVLPKNSKVGGNTVVFNITTPNAQSFMDSRGQIIAKLAGEMQRYRVRNN